MQIAEKVEKRVDRVYIFLRQYLDRWTFLETFRKIFAETKAENLRIDYDHEGNPKYLLPEVEFALYLKALNSGCGFE